MNDEDYKKTKEELEYESKNNNLQRSINNERMRLARANRAESKLSLTLLNSSLVYLIIFVVSMALAKYNVLSFSNAFYANAYPFVVIGACLGIGAVATKIIEHKEKLKERFKLFSNAHNESEKLQEEVKYSIEKEKVSNRNKALIIAKKQLAINQSMLNSLSSKYDITEKNENQNVELTKDIINELSKLLKDKYNELDVLTTQNVLYKTFRETLSNFERVERYFWTVLAVAFCGFCFFDLLIIGLMMISKSSNLFSILTFLAPLVICPFGTIGYMAKRNKDYRKAFDNLNDELKDNALSEKDFNCEPKFDEKITDKIREAGTIIVQLQERKRLMESIENNGMEETRELEEILKEEQTVSKELEEQGPSLKLKK